MLRSLVGSEMCIRDRDCSGVISIVNQPISRVSKLNVFPNPVNSTGTILLPKANYTDVKLFVVDAKGSKVNCPISYQADRITIEKGDLIKGTYFFFVRDNGVIVGTGKIIIN